MERFEIIGVFVAIPNTARIGLRFPHTSTPPDPRGEELGRVGPKGP